MVVGGYRLDPGMTPYLAHLDDSGYREFQAVLAGEQVFALARQADQRILMGGDFRFLNSQFRGGLARLNPDGSLDTTFDSGPGMVGTDDEYIAAILVQTDGGIRASRIE